MNIQEQFLNPDNHIMEDISTVTKMKLFINRRGYQNVSRLNKIDLSRIIDLINNQNNDRNVIINNINQLKINRENQRKIKVNKVEGILQNIEDDEVIELKDEFVNKGHDKTVVTIYTEFSENYHGPKLNKNTYDNFNVATFNKVIAKIGSDKRNEKVLYDVLRYLTRSINNENVMFLFNEENKIYYSITINTKDDFLDRIHELVNIDFKINDEEEEEDNENDNMEDHARKSSISSSGEETSKAIISLNTINYTFCKKIITNKRKGASFGYFNKTDLNLSEYQIYKENDEIDTTPCIIFCMQKSGIDQKKINNAKTYIYTDLIPLTYLKKIANKIGLYISVYDDKNRKTYRYGNKDETDKLNICLIEGHYFVINNKLGKRSNLIVRELLNNKEKNLIVRTDLIKQKESKVEENIIELEDFNIDGHDYREIKYKERKKIKNNYKQIIFFDFETTTNGTIHKPYLVSTKKFSLNEKGETRLIKNGDRTFFGEQCGKNFLNHITDNSVIIAHNLKYDFQFIVKYLFGLKITEKNNRLMGGQVQILNSYGKMITLAMRDSYLMIPIALKRFPQMFFNPDEAKNIKKEIIPYSLYTEENIKKETCLIKDALNILKKEDHEEFIKNLEKWNLIDNDSFYHLFYAKNYCKMDVEVTAKGYFTFRKWINEITGLDTLEYLTISSIADEYMLKSGCYEGCVEISGPARRFIQKCVVGGRCMTNENKKHICHQRVQDFDGVSLYPSAINRMAFLKGEPMILDKNISYDILKEYDGYFVEINITKIGKKYKFPLLSRITKDGVRNFSNNLTGKHFVDKFTLEDLINFHKIEFEIIRGVYFNKGRNDKNKEIILSLFNERIKKKAEKNQIQEVYKLILNSCYGKTILKEEKSKWVYKNNDKEALDYIMNNIEYINQFSKIEGSHKYRIKINKVTDDLYTRPHIGAEILSMSKRIMNEVMCTAEDIGATIYYQDTDSMHIIEKDIEGLKAEFMKRYGRELEGSNLGQFHCDFDMGQDKGTTPVSIKSIYCGKKTYMDVVEYVKNDEVKTSNHLRCKGIPSECLVDVCEEKKGGDYFELYKDMYNGKKFSFDLLRGGKKLRFKFNNNFTVSNVTSFNRSIKL
jgi:hypothetical protein